MILFVRTLSIKLGVYTQAEEFAKKVALLLKNKYDVKCQLFVQNAGSSPVGTIYWTIPFDDYSEYEKKMTKLGADEDYLALIGPAIQYFVDGTTFDNFLEPIPFEDD